MIWNGIRLIQIQSRSCRMSHRCLQSRSVIRVSVIIKRNRPKRPKTSRSSKSSTNPRHPRCQTLNRRPRSATCCAVNSHRNRVSRLSASNPTWTGKTRLSATIHPLIWTNVSSRVRPSRVRPSRVRPSRHLTRCRSPNSVPKTWATTRPRQN